ncbi:MAG: DNA mismatch repair endonuclease MutL [Deltaproteobacteria bacterium]|nr:DNA mismatch repair endonuclease MutL [Deltaproteobacteria bacterium]
MGRIHLLPDELINKIAAGEVVERPASVVKELLENSLDAGADQITVAVDNGGQDGIMVLDNGSGMNREDALLAYTRHATSKIATEQDLSAIRTLGFRGEALASIASVSRMELVTCTDEGQGATRVEMEGGRQTFCGSVGFAKGTRVTVRDLFYNTPARRKFMRSPATEFQHIQAAVTSIALADPGLRLRLLHNGKNVCDYTPAQGLAQRAFQLFGVEFQESMLWVEGMESALRFEGLASLPSASQATRRWQHLYVNGRAVKNPGLNHAVVHAYRTLLMKGRHPAYILMVYVNPEEVDVNVHPAKTEIRLRNPKLLHTVLADRLHRALMDATRRRAFVGGIEAEGPAIQSGQHHAAQNGVARSRQGVDPSDSQLEMRLPSGGDGPVRDWVKDRLAGPLSGGHSAGGDSAFLGGGGDSPPQNSNPPQIMAPPGFAPQGGASGSLRDNPLAGDEFHFQPVSGRISMLDGGRDTPLSSGLRVVGQFGRTYLLVQRGEELLVIDQHAAHERILFEKYRNQFYQGRLKTEPFLVPLTLELGPQNGLILEQHLPRFANMGFDIELFGKSTYLVRSIPALLSGSDVKKLILEVLDDLALFGKTGRLEEVINHILERVACHGAIRGGQELAREEMESLVAQLEQLDINLYCPHGRPVWVEITQRELEKRFKRIV